MSSSRCARPRIELVVTRHEQAAAFMAATHGRLTGEPGVCLSTLGPGALNLTTGAAFAHLGAMPMLMITGQKPIRKRQAGTLPDRRHRHDDAAAHEILAADRLGGVDPHARARGLPARRRGESGAGPSRAARGHRRRGGRRRHRAGASDRPADRRAARAAPRRRDDPRCQAPAGDDRGRAATGRACTRRCPPSCAAPACRSSTRRWARAR